MSSVNKKNNKASAEEGDDDPKGPNYPWFKGTVVYEIHTVMNLHFFNIKKAITWKTLNARHFDKTCILVHSETDGMDRAALHSGKHYCVQIT